MGIVATQTEGSSSGIRPAKVMFLYSDGNLVTDPSLSLETSASTTFPSTASRRLSSSLSSAIASAFLPSGYPASVTADYLSFQIWDTIQGLSSYVRGMLSTQAMLTGIGVGSATATPASAVVQFFYRDAIGLLAGVLFAALQGSSFDAYAKQWRLVADIANDIGLTAELAAPAFSSPSTFLLFACIGSICRAITGVAGGATRMALTQHFALQGNAADIAAKEGSQETAVTLLGMILGLGLTRIAANNIAAAWVAFVAMTVLHVYANMRAMRCLCITRLNSERLDIIIKKYRETKKVPTPIEVASLERLMPPSLQRWFVDKVYKRLFGMKESNQQWDVLLVPDLSSLTATPRKLVADGFSKNLENKGNTKRNNAIITLKNENNISKSRSIVVPDAENKKLYVFVQQANGGASNDDGHNECGQLVQSYCKARYRALELENSAVDSNNDKYDDGRKLVVEDVAAVVDESEWVKLLTEAGWSCDRPALSQGRMRVHWGDRAALGTKKEN
ncbi:hypothetical protein Ndes2437B_g04800 [Nannochloris sp. 'desiccata']